MKKYVVVVENVVEKIYNNVFLLNVINYANFL